MKQLINIYEKYQKSTISLKKIPKDKTDRYRIISGDEIKNNIYRIKNITERFENEKPTDLAVIGRCILTPDIIDKINETEVGFAGEIHLTDALLKLDCVYGTVFEGKSYYIENSLDWLKASIEFGLDDKEFRDDLVRYMESYI